MRQAFLVVLVSMIVSGVGICQQVPGDGGARMANGQAVPPAAPASDTRAVEINSLRTDLARIQQRLDQLAPPADNKAIPYPLPQLGTGPAPQVDPPFISGTVDHSLLPRPAEGDSGWPLRATWNNGLQIESKNEDFRIHIGGNLQFDSGWNTASQAVQFGPGGIGELQDGALFRRASVRTDGTLYQHFEWVAEFDFANDVQNDTSSSTTPVGSPSFTDVWVAVNDLPLVGTVRTGWMKEPIGFEHLVSSRWLNFMERAPGGDSLGLHSPGVMILNTSPNQRVTWAVGVFHSQNDNFGFGIGDGEYDYTGRITGLAWYEDNGEHLLHLGFGATHRHLSADQIDLHGRPSVRTMPTSLLPSLAETGTISGDTQEVLDVELAGVFGPWTLQAEYAGTFIHDAVFPNEPPPTGVARGTLFYQLAYVELLYFLTGEHRAYDLKNAVFDRVVPLRNFNVWSDEYGWGAWQVGLRYAYLDLQDKGVNGAVLNDIVFGVNWFLNPNMKVQWNFAVDHRESAPPGSSGWTYIYGTRVALDF
jgi:phosphate-selective porin OprO/OprP